MILMFLIFIYFQTLMFIVAIYDQTIVKIDSLKLSYKKTRMMMRVFYNLKIKQTF